MPYSAEGTCAIPIAGYIGAPDHHPNAQLVRVDRMTCCELVVVDENERASVDIGLSFRANESSLLRQESPDVYARDEADAEQPSDRVYRRWARPIKLPWGSTVRAMRRLRISGIHVGGKTTSPPSAGTNSHTWSRSSTST